MDWFTASLALFLHTVYQADSTTGSSTNKPCWQASPVMCCFNGHQQGSKQQQPDSRSALELTGSKGGRAN